MTPERRQSKREYLKRYYKTNRDVALQRSREWYAANRDRALNREKERRVKEAAKLRDQRLRKQFGISASDYDAILARQGGACAVCGSKELPANGAKYMPLPANGAKYMPLPANGAKYMPVDHSHKSGVVRGILCDLCNRGIGLLADSAQLCVNAAHYLSRYERHGL